jgi:hypothetical protein
MKKITLLFAFLLATIGWQSNAQFTEDFEGTFLPTGWAKVVQSGNDITQSTSQNHTPSGANSCRFSSFSSSSDYNQYLFTDAITVQAGVNDFISFYHKKYDSTELLEWGIATAQDATTVTTWTAVTLSHTDWVIERVDLSAYVGQTIYFAWHYFGNYTYYVYIDDVVNEPVPAAFDPSFTLAAVPDCANNQFSIDVDITSLGGATSVTVSDDQGSATQQATATGIVTMGPYPSDTDVAITVTNDQDANYTTTENIRYGCPPANDVCNGAIALNVDPDACVTPTVADNTFATDSGVAAPTCASYSGGDLWFSATIPASGSLTIESSTITGSDFADSGMAVYSGDCANLTEMECNDDGGAGAMSKIELTGQTAGDVVYIRVWEYGNNAFGEINVCAFDPLATLENNHISGFNFYPNPVNNTLNMSAQDNIEKVSIYNISGQEVINVTPNAVQTQVDMSRLQNGIYFVKAQVNGQLTAFKVVKK